MRDPRSEGFDIVERPGSAHAYNAGGDTPTFRFIAESPVIVRSPPQHGTVPTKRQREQASSSDSRDACQGTPVCISDDDGSRTVNRETIAELTIAIVSPRDDAPIVSQCDRLEGIGEAYHTHRQNVCLSRSLGLTKVYNLFHNPTCHDADIAELRRLHVAMDTAVAAAYGWEDIALRHAFYGEGKETRYTLHPDAKSEVLRRLLTLNHERHAEQEAQSAEVLPALAGERATRQTRRTSKIKETKAPYAEGQTSLDPLLVEAFLEERQRERTAGGNHDLERAAMMATYLIMRAEAPEQLNRLRRYPAKMRLTVPRTYRRIRLAKHLYFAQEMMPPKHSEHLPVTALEFTEYPHGPYTKQIEQAEQEAIRRGWLTVEAVWEDGQSSVSYTLGSQAEAAVKQVLALLGEEEPHLDQELVPLDEEKTVRSEQWTTVHFAWKKLREQAGREPDLAEIEAYVHHWKPDRAAFAHNAIRVTYQELKLRRILP